MKFFFLFLSVLYLFSSCDRPYSGFEMQGPDQFVIDSYKIRGGKNSILEMQGKIVHDLPKDSMEEYKDLIHEDDILRIVLHHPTRQDIASIVNQIGSTVGYPIENGMISLPDLAPVFIRELSLEEAARKIEEKYLGQAQDVEVFLGYRDRLIRKVDLMGMTQTPAMPVNGKLRLYEALALAKIPQQANLFMSYVVRNNELLPIDLNKLIKEGDMSQNIVMRGGDKIYIADLEDAKIMMMGEVGYPRSISLPVGHMSLREALVRAGGIPFTGDKKYIQVIRGDLTKPKIYLLNWNVIVNLPNDSLLLMPGDTVYVSAKPITEWNRFISQLMPSFQGIQGTVSTSKILGLQ